MQRDRPALEAPALHTLRLIARQPWRHCVTSLRSAHWLASSLKLAARCPVSGCWPSCWIPAWPMTFRCHTDCIRKIDEPQHFIYYRYFHSIIQKPCASLKHPPNRKPAYHRSTISFQLLLLDHIMSCVVFVIQIWSAIQHLYRSALPHSSAQLSRFLIYPSTSGGKVSTGFAI